APPPGVDTTLPPASESTSTRERFAQDLEDPTCASCHVLMDPLGLSFEHYGPMGEYRTHDGLTEVDASGELSGTDATFDGPYYGAVELAAKLASNEQVANCLTNQWFRFALGRMETDLDACTIQTLRQTFASSGHDGRAPMKQLAVSDAFRNVRATAQ